MPDPLTYDEYVASVCEQVKLQLWFVRSWLAAHPGETFADVLIRRTDVPRWSGHGRPRPAEAVPEDPEWPDLERHAEEIYRRTRGDADSSRFEAEGLALFLDGIRDQARRNEERGFLTVPASSQCSSLRYDPPKPENPRRVPFHIGNAVRPRSIFDDPTYLPACLRCLMDKSEAEFGCDSLSTATWLNEYPRWLALFPDEWRDNMGPPMTDTRRGLGFWGQFITARGTFHARRAAAFRATGRMPYLPRPSWCTFAALRQHLDVLTTAE